MWWPLSGDSAVAITTGDEFGSDRGGSSGGAGGRAGLTHTPGSSCTDRVPTDSAPIWLRDQNTIVNPFEEES